MIKIIKIINKIIKTHILIINIIIFIIIIDQVKTHTSKSLELPYFGSRIFY
jgi:hypothetical protein